MKAATDKHVRYPYCFYCNKVGKETRAISQCMNCRRYLCKVCLDKHHEKPQFSNHVIVTLRNEKEELCSKHDETVLYVCRACTPARLLCDVCMVLDDECHTPEGFMDYASAVSEMESQLESHIHQTMDVDDKVSKVESIEKTLTQQVEENADAFIKCIEATKIEIVSKIKRCFDVQSLKVAAKRAKEAKLKAQELLGKGKKKMNELSETAGLSRYTLQQLSKEEERALNVDINQFHKEEKAFAGFDGAYMKFRLFDFPTKIEGLDLPRIPGYISPPETSEMRRFIGKLKGIQGHHNSCYMDTTLFSMFAYNQSFDHTYLREKIDNYDKKEWEKVQEVLKERIINRLRSEFYVPGGQMMHLRNLLEKLSTVQGWNIEEKDPEGFLNLLLGNVMEARPFFHLTSGFSGHLYQLFVERDGSLIMPTTQRLLGLSLKQMGTKFCEPPNVLILKLPRSGSRYKMFERVICSLELDITSLLENAPKECVVCGELAIVECTECYRQFGEKLDLCLVPFCFTCDEKSHGHQERCHHKRRDLSGVNEYTRLCNEKGMPFVPVRHEYLELFAVMCIETSHYVAFVKCGTGAGAKWMFFDSMADREGGRNIPEVSLCPEVEEYLDPKGHVKATCEDDKEMPEKIRRLLSDPLICMYRSPDGAMLI